MTAEDFKNQTLEGAEVDRGLCPPPTDAQKGLDILINHFLGEDWYTSLPLCQEQVNTEAIYAILEAHPKRMSFKERVKQRLQR